MKGYAEADGMPKFKDTQYPVNDLVSVQSHGDLRQAASWAYVHDKSFFLIVSLGPTLSSAAGVVECAHVDMCSSMCAHVPIILSYAVHWHGVLA